MKTTLYERTSVCGTCYAGRNRTCANRNKANVQTACCVVAARKQGAV